MQPWEQRKWWAKAPVDYVEPDFALDAPRIGIPHSLPDAAKLLD